MKRAASYLAFPGIQLSIIYFISEEISRFYFSLQWQVNNILLNLCLDLYLVVKFEFKSENKNVFMCVESCYVSHKIQATSLHKEEYDKCHVTTNYDDLTTVFRYNVEVLLLTLYSYQLMLLYPY